MLEIVDRTEEMLRKGNGTGRACGGAGGREKVRLQYLGFSYGSVLGNTFASMFPGRVGRMVVDGIADGEDYTAGVSAVVWSP
jgi:pimeloyl-ACP methyl ester carboxylesterase